MKPLRPKILAIILAGGAGGRLGALTDDRAKPAMPFAGTHRLIDFALSNCLHSGLTDVWVIEQSELHSLNDHLANGRPWDLDRTHGGLQVLPPSAEKGGKEDEGGFAHGNADALWRQRKLIREFASDLLLVLSADHIYRCDFRDVIDAHLRAPESGEQAPALTLVTTPVPPGDDPSRFSLVRVDKKTARVTDFAYKPKKPASNLAATEIFLFDTAALLETLEALSAGDAPLKDYGDALLPRLVEAGRVRAHPLGGYWRDVGTLESYFRAHQDLLKDAPPLRVAEPGWPILTFGQQSAPARIYKTAQVDNSLISSGCVVRGRVKRSVLGPGVIVAEGAEIADSILFQNARVASGARVRRAIVDERAQLGENAQIGRPPKLTIVPKNARLKRGTRLGPESSKLKKKSSR